MFPDNIPTEGPRLGRHNSANSGRNRRADVVASKYSEAKPISNPSRTPEVNNRIGRLYGRLGLPKRSSLYRRKMDHGGFEKISPHKSAGTPCSVSSVEINGKRNEGLYHNNEAGQPVSCLLHKQAGGYTFSGAKFNCTTNLGMVPGAEDLVTCGTPPGEAKHPCGLAIPKLYGFQRLETEGRHSESSVHVSPPLRRGSLCQPNQPPAPSLLVVETGPRSGRDGCPNSVMDKPSGIRIPTVLSSGKMRSEVHSRKCQTPSCGSLVAQPALVPSATQTLDSSRNSASTGSRSPPGHQQEASSITSTEVPTVSGLDNSKLSTRASELISSCVRRSTKKCYDSAWKCFKSWCCTEGRDSSTVTIPDILNYLTFLESSKKLSYRTINLHRSALSFHLSKLDGYPVGSHPSVVKLLKGIFNENPPQPKYRELWDVSLVINHLSSLPPNSELKLPVLSRKLVMLLALTNADRSSDIRGLSVCGIKFIPEGVVLQHCDLKKTSKSHFMPDSFYPKFPDNENLCVVMTLQEYLSRTKDFRVGRKDTHLILSYIRPHNPVSSSTIARWIIFVMNASGVDTTQFSAHSTRGVSVTSARNFGVSIADIQKCADWRTQTTFTRFYYRPKFSSNFGNAILYS